MIAIHFYMSRSCSREQIRSFAPKRKTSVMTIIEIRHRSCAATPPDSESPEVDRCRTGEKPVLCITYAMKSRHSFARNVLLIFAFVCAIFIGTVAQGAPFGHLIVQRTPNFGWNLAFNLQIDGRSVATIVPGRRYDGWVPAGRHVLTVSAVPSIYVGYSEPTSTIVNVRPGEAYVFTAMWDSNMVFLRRWAVLSPGEFWQLRGDLG